jgi:hypothetical protein
MRHRPQRKTKRRMPTIISYLLGLMIWMGLALITVGAALLLSDYLQLHP